MHQRTWLLGVLSLLWMPGWADTIVHTDSWQELQAVVRDSDWQAQETMVFFDVNDVLIAPQDAALSKPYRADAIKRIKKIHGVEEAPRQSGVHAVAQDPIVVTETFMDIWTKSTITLVDSEGPEAIDNLKREGFHVLGLTNAITGPMGALTDMVAYRTEELYRLGYHFAADIGQDGLVLGDNPQVGNGRPVYQDGIIYTAGLPKGPILDHFLNHIPEKPKRIVFVDDKASNLDSVAAFCHKNAIEFVGVHYTAADSPRLDQDAEQKLADCQFTHYQQFGQWLGDAEAQKTRCFIEG